MTLHEKIDLNKKMFAYKISLLTKTIENLIGNHALD